MNIRSISVFSTKGNLNKPQNFKGLWDKSSQTSDIDPALNIPLVKKGYYYHPFADETEEQIAQVIKANSHAQIIQDPKDKYEIKECKRALRTPFTKDQYEKYKKIDANSFLSTELRKIHYYVSNKFDTSGFDGTEQKSAINPNVNV